MGTPNEQYFDWLCRTCMHELTEINTFEAKSLPEQQWRFLFEKITECDALTIEELLSNIIPQIKFEVNDKLPKKVCEECFGQLQNAYQFQKRCLQSDKHMHELISKNGADLKTSTSEFSEDDELYAKNFLKLEYVNSIPETTRPNTADPLQSFGEVDISDSVKHEPCNNVEPNDVYSDCNIIYSKKDIKETITEEQVTLGSSTNTCSVCNKSFKNPRYLQNHLKRHQVRDDELKQDEQRGISVKPKNDINIHTPTVAGEADNKLLSLTCEFCEKTCGSLLTLSRHEKKRHPDKYAQKNKDKKKIACKFCNKTFERRFALTLHLTKHTGERPYLCHECGKSFSTAGNLKTHRLRHSEVKPFECPYCPKKFYCTSDVSKHAVIHRGIKSHVCDVCGYKTTDSHQLMKHKRHHTGERPYKCEYCEMRFVRADHQRRHMRTHTGEKPYECKYCDRAFAQSGDHIKHLRIHLGENVYRCELCPLAFRLASELRLHFATHKNDDEEMRERNIKALKEEEAKLQIRLGALEPRVDE